MDTEGTVDTSLNGTIPSGLRIKAQQTHKVKLDRMHSRLCGHRIKIKWTDKHGGHRRQNKYGRLSVQMAQ